MSKEYENDELREEAGVITDNEDTSVKSASEDTSDKPIKKYSSKKKKMPKWGTALIVIGCFVISGVVISAIISSVKKMQTAMQEATEQMSGDDLYTVEKIDIEQEVSTSGITIGLEENAYTSPVTAKVNDIRVEAGQTIHKGEVLLTYDTSELDDNLTKVKIQAQSERAAVNESFEAANDAADKASDASSKAKKLKKQVKSLKNDITSISDKISTAEEEVATIQNKYTNITNTNGGDSDNSTEGTDVTDTQTSDAGMSAEDTARLKELNDEIKSLNKKLTSKNDELTEKQTDLAEQETIVSANKDVKVSESTKAQASATRELSDMNINDAQESFDEGAAGLVAQKDGIVTSVQIVKGAYASETQTLVTMIDADKIGVEFSISKDDLGSIEPNQKVRIVIGNQQYEGVVTYISRVASSETSLTTGASTGGTIQGKILVNNPDDKLYIGVSAKVYIFVGKSEGTLGVPYEALNTDINGDYVYVVDKDNKIRRKDVTIGIYSDEYYEVTEGIEEGDRVIREVTKDMKPGDEYVPQASAMPNMLGM